MEINAIKLNIPISFKGEKDEYQPLSKEMQAIFRENTESKARQRLLWELSEVPNFYEATKDCTKRELLEIADLFESQRTNILKMALDGDIQVIKKSKNGKPKIRKILSLSDYIQHNKNIPAEKRERLIDYLKQNFVEQVEDDAIEQFFDTKEYPTHMRYIKDKGNDGKTWYMRLLDSVAAVKSIMSVLSKGSPLDDDDVDVVFERDIQKRTGKKIVGFDYSPINPKDIEEEYPIEYPEIYKVLEQTRNIPSAVINSANELRKIPYFKNLTKNSYPQQLLEVAELNAICDNLLANMLKQTAMLEVRNPLNGQYVKIPVIDVGRILLDIKNGDVKEKNIYKILQNQSLALEFCELYAIMREQSGNKKIKNMKIERFGNNLYCLATTEDGEPHSEIFTGEHVWDSKILAKLDTLPFKKAVFNLDIQK